MSGSKKFFDDLRRIGDNENELYEIPNLSYMTLVTVSIFPKSISFSTKSGERLHIVRAASEEELSAKFGWLARYVVDLHLPCESEYFDDHQGAFSSSPRLTHLRVGTAMAPDYVQKLLCASKSVKFVHCSYHLLTAGFITKAKEKQLEGIHVVYFGFRSVNMVAKHAVFHPKVNAVTVEIDDLSQFDLRDFLVSVYDTCDDDDVPKITPNMPIFNVTGLIVNFYLENGLSTEDMAIQSALHSNMIEVLLSCFPDIKQLEFQFYTYWQGNYPNERNMNLLIDTFNDIKAKIRALVFGINIRVVYNVNVSLMPGFLEEGRTQDYCVRGDLVVTHPEDSVICFETRDCRLTPTHTLKCFVRYVFSVPSIDLEDSDDEELSEDSDVIVD